jgi:adenine-specific DNA methylase
MADDLFDEFLEYDLSLGADVVKCPHCGAEVPCSLLFPMRVIPYALI